MAAGLYKTVSLTATGQSTAIPVNFHGSGNIPIGIVLDFTTVAAVGTASAEFTFDDIFDSTVTPTWFAFSDLSGKSATAQGVEQMPCRAVRLNVTAYTSGTISMRVMQGVL